MGFFDDIINKVTEEKPSLSITSFTSKSTIIGQAASVNYDGIATVVASVSDKFPEVKGIIPAILILKEASNNYNLSESENKDEEFINFLIDNTDIEKIIENISPLIEYIPNGKYIIMIFRFVVKLIKE